MKESDLKKMILIVVIAVVGILFLFLGGNIFEQVDADEIMILQDPWDGELHYFTNAGMKWQGFGKVTKYKKRSQFWFSAKKDQGETLDQSIKVRFNDKGHANISGSLAWEMPLDEDHLIKIHTKYGSQEAIETQLIRTVVEKSVYMTGPLMSSQESAAERRNDLLQYIEDQISNGVYKTETIQEKQADSVTGKMKTVSIVRLVHDEKGKIMRSDVSPLKDFGIKTFNPSINEVVYDATVEKQIMEQQNATMAVQTSIANAKKAEQDAITTAKNGEAAAAKAKWDQEAVKARETTKAEQRRDVARLDRDTADLRKQEQILIGEGEAERRRLNLSADGALGLKLEKWLEAQKAWAQAFSTARTGALVPYIVMNGGGNSKNSSQFSADQWMSLIGMKTARDLSLDLSIPKGKTK